jgi:hypothetical protein
VSRESNIDEKDVRAVLLLNQLRMQKKGKNYGMTSLEESQLCNQLQKTGCICILKKDGRICAGLLCTVTGTDVFMHVLAHDPSFDKLRLGLVCCCLTIEYVIEQQFKCLHFLWGHYDYKRQLGAQPIELSRVLVARNLSVGLLHPLFFCRYFFDRVRDLLRAFRHRRKVRINHWLRRSPC